jgi:hypothetical protein
VCVYFRFIVQYAITAMAAMTMAAMSMDSSVLIRGCVGAEVAVRHCCFYVCYLAV